MFHVSRSTFFVLTLCALTLSGCFGGSKENLERAFVSGTVRFDGKPLSEGSIQFIPDLDATGQRIHGKAVQAIITNGVYMLEADQGPVVGANKIMVNATRKTGKFQNFDGVKTEIMQQYIPAKYNADSTLRYEVKAGENTADFSLQTR
ncbi:hypothetical protein [Gimesia algae]|uniref:Uncharacterized protein n=1 Tax=Gimesia algae TaxID=2527971 RepID=A0A517VE02_9PLAN|nr:hypothetical protein [Gimesia algae]QDT91238.1 hypothetical protein Pan161_28940 [Gimesia algae]